MSLVLTEMISGRSYRLCALRSAKESPVLAFLTEQEQKHQKEWDKLMKLLDYIAEHGTPNNEEKCKFIKKEGVFELKTGGGLRLFAFYGKDRSLIVCSHGFVKKRSKTPKEQLKRAKQAREAYEKAYQDDDIRYE
jgi:phage-related protein